MNARQRLASLVVFLTCSGLAAARSGNTWYVDGNAPCPGLGTLSSPYCRLQYAIEQPTTNDGDTIVVAPGIYEEVLVIEGKSLSIVSSGTVDATTLRALGPWSHRASSALRIEGIPGTSVHISGFTFECGWGYSPGSPTSKGPGGGILCRNAALSIDACEFKPLLTPPGPTIGGGVHVEDSVLVVRDSTFMDLTAQRGAGLSCVRTIAQVERCLFSRNGRPLAFSPLYGGGVYCETSDVTILDSVFDGNLAAFGGGVYGSAIIRECQFTYNSAGDGGGVAGGAFVSSSTLTNNRAERGGAAAGCRLVDSILSWNRAIWNNVSKERGGGAFQCELDGCVVVGNEAYIAGGGLLECRAEWCIIAGNGARKDGAAAVSSTLDHCTIYGNMLTSPGGTQVGGTSGCTITNSIVWNNTPLNCDPTTLASYSDIQGGWPGVGNIDADPLLWNPDGHDFHLLQGSPCIDTGDPSYAPDPDGSKTDMGAVWFDSTECLQPFVFCTAKTNSQGCDPRIGSEGTCVAGNDGFYVTAYDVVNHSPGLLLWGLQTSTTPFYGGTLCVATTNRLSPQNSMGTAPPPPCTGSFSTHFSATVMAKYALTAGTAVYAQYWYRDAAHPDGTGVGLTDALGFVICTP